MTTTCLNCESIFGEVNRNEDGSPALETTRCSHPGCEVYLCQAACEHLSFTCEACGNRFCAEHKFSLDEMKLCLGCALESVESQEPECACSQSDVDSFDARGCPLHDGNSSWNLQLRALSLIQEYEAAAQTAKRTSGRDLEGADGHALDHQQSIRTGTYQDFGGNDASSQTRHAMSRRK